MNFKKIILSICLTFLIISFSKAQDNTGDIKKSVLKDKKFDFIVNAVIAVGFTPVSFENNKFYEFSMFKDSLNGLSIPLMCGFSFFYYFNNFNALGLTAKFGSRNFIFSIFSYIFDKNYFVDLQWGLYISYKTGTYKSKALFEFGINLNYRPYFYKTNPYLNTFDNYFTAGPELFIGWDYGSLKGFSLILGGFFNVLSGRLTFYHTYPDYNDIYADKNDLENRIDVFNYTVLTVGVEIRLGIVKNLYKN